MRWVLVASLTLIACSSDDTYASCNIDGFCCCSGDALDPVTCGPSGPTCKRGTLHKGDDCQCLPDRNTPCCAPHIYDSGQPDTRVSVDSSPRDSAYDANDCSAACCCQGDLLSTVQCTDAGPTCASGFNLHYGDDCDCLPDRNTPCCAPH